MTSLIPYEDFAEDEQMNLGKANGNIFYRRSGLEGVHDGQVLVRLKSRRFILLDYSIIPNQMQTSFYHSRIPPGAGTATCCSTSTKCSKVGVPVLLYDSHPQETPSLYVRSGLCFTCQRNLNESRRAQRKSTKRKATTFNNNNDDNNDHSGEANIIYAVGPQAKYFQIHNDDDDDDKKPITLRSDAIILNGTTLEGLPIQPPLQDSKSVREMGFLLEQSVRDALVDTERLRQESSSSFDDDDLLVTTTTTTTTSDEETIQALYHKAFTKLHTSILLLSHWKTAWDNNNSNNSNYNINHNTHYKRGGGAMESGVVDSGVVSLLMAADKRDGSASSVIVEHAAAAASSSGGLEAAFEV